MSKPVLKKNQVLEILHQLKPVLSEKYGVTRLGVFGSVAREQATEKSDVDIVFETDRPNLLMTAMMQQELEALLGCRVDIVRLGRYLHPNFRAQLEKDAVYV